MVPNFLGGLKRKSLVFASPTVISSAVVVCVILVTLPGFSPRNVNSVVSSGFSIVLDSTAPLNVENRPDPSYALERVS